MNTIMYVLLGIWLLLWPFPFLIFIPFMPLFYFAFIILSPSYSIYLFAKKNERRLKKNVTAILFLLPAVIMSYHILHDTLQPYVNAPSEVSVKSYIQSEYNVFHDTIDLDRLQYDYDRSDKHMDISIVLIPNHFFHELGTSYTNGRFMRTLYSYYVVMPKSLTQVSRQAKTVTVHGYWGDTRILDAQFRKSGGHYELIEPLPNVSLLSENNKWYLRYQEGTEQKVLFLKEFANSNPFVIELFQ